MKNYILKLKTYNHFKYGIRKKYKTLSRNKKGARRKEGKGEEK